MAAQSSGIKTSSLYLDTYFLRSTVKSSLPLFLNWRPLEEQQWASHFRIFVKEPEKSTQGAGATCPVSSLYQTLEVGRREPRYFT